MQLIFFVIVLLLGYTWIKRNITLPDSSYSSIIHLLITVTLYFIAFILTWSFITSFLPWILFIFKRNNNEIVLKINTAVEGRSDTKQPVSISLFPVYVPVFGFLRMRLQYDKKFSGKFSIISTQTTTSFFSSTLNGIYNWQIPEIREYKIGGAIVYFEDMFQLFSFAVSIPAHDTFFTQPESTSLRLNPISPKKTENTNIRIQKMRRVEGEFLNYKNFENNDDVRRIVWKIYARNKELVIRIPETNDPYASHIYFFASFFQKIKDNVFEEVETILLNHYKTVVWNTYLSLSKQNMQIRYVDDQPKKNAYFEDPLQKIKYTISTSIWQNNKDLDHYFKKEDGSVLCISSFTNTTELQKIIESSGKDVVIVYVQLSKAFTPLRINDWIRWFFVRPAKDNIEKLRFKWNISPFKQEVLRNEKAILSVLQKGEPENIIT